MMKRLLWLMVLAIFFASCGAKKRSVAIQKTQKQTKRYPSTTVASGEYALPEDTGKFVRFPISSVKDYIETFSEIAQFEMKAYGVPASIM